METYKSCSPMNNYRNMSQRYNCGRPVNHMHHNHNISMSRPSNNDNCNMSNNQSNNNSCNNSCNNSSESAHHHKQDLDCHINTIINSINPSADCKDSNPHLGKMPLASAFVPTQPWCKLYDKKEAICQGTAFPNLNLIFCGSRGRM